MVSTRIRIKWICSVEEGRRSRPPRVPRVWLLSDEFYPPLVTGSLPCRDTGAADHLNQIPAGVALISTPLYSASPVYTSPTANLTRHEEPRPLRFHILARSCFRADSSAAGEHLACRRFQ